MAIQALLTNKVVVYPTETAYGLGGNALNKDVVQKIYTIKDRPKEKLLTVIVASFEMAYEFFEFDHTSLSLAKKYWPGALTLLVRPKTSVLDILFAVKVESENYGAKAQNKIGVRISSNKIARALSEGINSPLIATSANVSGHPPCYTKDEVIQEFQGRTYAPDFMLDYGHLQNTKPSTIVAVEDGVLKVVRQGVLFVGM